MVRIIQLEDKLRVILSAGATEWELVRTIYSGSDFLTANLRKKRLE
jgi:hypothetical protein